MTHVEAYLSTLKEWLKARQEGLSDEEERAWFKLLDAQWHALTEAEQDAADQALAEMD